MFSMLKVIGQKQGYGCWIFPEIQCWGGNSRGSHNPRPVEETSVEAHWVSRRLLSRLRILLRLDAHALVELLLIRPQLGLQGVKLAGRPRHLEAGTRLL